MPYQYKREPLSDDEVNRLINACETFKEKFVINAGQGDDRSYEAAFSHTNPLHVRGSGPVVLG